MASNTVIIRQGEPIPAHGERFISCDKGITFEIESKRSMPNPDGCFAGKGKLYVSTHRILFVRDTTDRTFSSFSLPYCTLIKFSLKNPMIGKARLEGSVRPIPNGGLTDIAKFKIYFENATVLKAANRLVAQQMRDFQQSSNKAFYLLAERWGSLPFDQICERHQQQAQQPAAKPGLIRPATLDINQMYRASSLEQSSQRALPQPSEPRVAYSEPLMSGAEGPGRECGRPEPRPMPGAPQYGRPPHSTPQGLPSAPPLDGIAPIVPPQVRLTESERAFAAQPNVALNQAIHQQAPPGEEGAYGMVQDTWHPTSVRPIAREQDSIAYIDEGSPHELILT